MAKKDLDNQIQELCGELIKASNGTLFCELNRTCTQINIFTEDGDRLFEMPLGTPARAILVAWHYGNREYDRGVKNGQKAKAKAFYDLMKEGIEDGE